VVVSDGSLWVLDGAPPFVTRVEPGSGEVLQFGPEGDGPGELRDPWAIQPTLSPSEPGVLVWDFGAGLVSEFDADSGFVASARLSDTGRIRARADIRQVSYGDPFRVRNDGRGYFATFFPGRVDRTGDLAAGVLHRSDRLLDPGPELASFSDHMGGGVSTLQEWAAVPFWDACDGVVALWSPQSASVVWLQAGGEARARVPVSLPATPLSLEDRARYLEWMARLELGPDFERAGIDFTALARAHQDRFVELRPLATDLRCEGRDVAWIRLFDTSADPLGRGQAWLRVSADGAYERFHFPPEFTPATFDGQGIYGVLEVPEGYQALAWWGMDPAATHVN
jgi:hypothetical protein